ncbi:hypothetical protein [Actinotalea sp. Marseille-Q4924]|uniref:hypothetical protein n=1 Tax=Actinotalea sp. Marseille-Q4924 TaxID=2866571 RepID=UPI001CE4711C|nr:hypothetical protein [Actinotalea sp. Marseille-Q4924]
MRERPGGGGKAGDGGRSVPGPRRGEPDPDGPLDAMLLRASGPGEEALASLVRRARLDEAVDVDRATATRMVGPVAWLVERVGVEGVPLTAAGYLRPVDVAAVAHELDLAEEWQGTLTRESSTVPVLVWREALQRAGVLRVVKGRLHATRAAAALADDPVGLWWFLAQRLPVGTTAEHDAGVVMLLELAGDDAAADDDTPAAPGLAAVGHTRTGAAMHALGWCDRDGGVLGTAEVRSTAERTIEILHRMGAYLDAGMLGRRAVPTPEGVLFARAALQSWR